MRDGGTNKSQEITQEVSSGYTIPKPFRFVTGLPIQPKDRYFGAQESRDQGKAHS
jgi:hypothetical protein